MCSRGCWSDRDILCAEVFKGWYLVDYHFAQHRHDVSRVETVGNGNTINHDFLFHKRFMFCPRLRCL